MYNPFDWYWTVGTKPGFVFSSQANAYVTDDNETFVAWHGAGFWPSQVPNESALVAALSPYMTPEVPLGLVVYANAKQWELATGGFTATVGGTARTFATDSISQGLITGKAVRFGQVNPPTSVDWQFADVGFVTISATDFITAAISIADFVQATFDSLKTALAAIQAGTITDIAGVDAAAWPANHQ